MTGVTCDVTVTWSVLSPRSQPRWCWAFVVFSVKCRVSSSVFVGVWGKGAFGSPRRSPAFPGSPHPSQRPSWLEQEVRVFGRRGEAETCASQNRPPSLGHANQVALGSRGRQQNRLWLAVGLTGRGCFTSQAQGGSAGGTCGLWVCHQLCFCAPLDQGSWGLWVLQPSSEGFQWDRGAMTSWGVAGVTTAEGGE